METKEIVILAVGGLITLATGWIASWVNGVSKVSNKNTTDIEVLKTRLENNSKNDEDQKKAYQDSISAFVKFQDEIRQWMQKVDQDITRIFERLPKQQ